MGNIGQLDVKARREAIRVAGKRWQDRRQARERGLSDIAVKGPGAADTAKHQWEFANRQAAKSSALLARVTNERVIGTPDWTQYSPSERASKAADPVARIVELPGDQEHEAQGFATGFLVSDRLLLTNYHVFPNNQSCVGCGAHFRYYCDERGPTLGIFFELDPDMFYLSDENWDFALVGVKSKGLKGEMLVDCGQVRLIEATGKIQTGDAINIIQHSSGGVRQYAITHNRLVDILDMGYLHYETDTARGSSGSPVFNDDWELVALHHSGVPEMANGEILKKDGTPWTEEDSEESIHWIANEGIRVSTLVKALRQKEAELPSPDHQKLLRQLLAATSDPVRVAEPIAGPPIMTGNEARVIPSQNTFNIQGNATIYVYGGISTLPGVADVYPSSPRGTDSIPALVLEKTLLFDLEYEKRKGYNADFLGVTIDLPKVDPARQEELYLVSDYIQHSQTRRNIPRTTVSDLQERDPFVLHYHHYSLVMNKQYRMCMWTASNCDYTEDMRRDRRARKDFGGESWRLDPRVPNKFQLTDAEIYKPAGNFDRGHIHRREDNCWGQPGLETDFGNSDTYHLTNCTPQHELFNQEQPKGEEYKGRKGVWGYFEAELEKQIKESGGQAVLFAGPILDGDCPSKDFGKGPVKYPLKFWKVVIVPESTALNPRLLAYGFVFDQTDVINKFGIGAEALDLPKFKRERKPLKEISELSGILFPDNVMEADQYKSA